VRVEAAQDDKRTDVVKTHVAVQWLFLRALGLIYALAFLSLALQVQGLIGSHGILPVSDYLAELAEQITPGARIWSCPTLLWLNQSDAFLNLLCWGGVLAGLGVMLNVVTAPLLVVAWLFYLSLVNVGQDFLSFQWDTLLLETGFLAIFWAPWQWFGPPWKTKLVLEPQSGTFGVTMFLFRWLLFRLMFMSGAVKLHSGDASWRNLSAMKYHYLTQPLPTPLAWLANQLPNWFQSLSVAGCFIVELPVPFLFFFPQPWRAVGAALTAMLQLLIMFTGNYTFFNVLTLALCLTLLSDEMVLQVMPKRWRVGLIGEAVVEETTARPADALRPIVRKTAIAGIATLVMLVTLIQISGMLLGIRYNSPLVRTTLEFVDSFHISATYGLFAVMTTTRKEISVEGSNDGVNWQPYVFKYKPGPLNRPPPIVAPLQPRLDWQMWFAALESAQDSPWFFHFVYRLLEGSPDVVQLLANDPFHGRPPKLIRAVLYDYRFTTWEELLATHNWWKRTEEGLFLPPVSTNNFRVR
jgi:hypothetical protein